MPHASIYSNEAQAKQFPGPTPILGSVYAFPGT